MDVVLTWGPERMVPEIDRLRKRQPALTDNELKQALSEAWKVLGEAEAHAPAVKSGGSGASQALMRNRPWLTAEQASQAISQGLYYHWRETGE